MKHAYPTHMLTERERERERESEREREEREKRERERERERESTTKQECMAKDGPLDPRVDVYHTQVHIG